MAAGPAEPEYPNGPVVNYGAILDYEPRIADPLGSSSREMWGRGVPRVLIAYVGAVFVALIVVTHIGPLGVVFGAGGGVWHVAIVLGLSAAIGGWAWAMPPGGVRAHQAVPAIWRGLRAPRLMMGWVPVGRYPAGWAPPEVIVEPDFAGRWPHMQVTGPMQLVRTQAASRLVRRGARRGEAGLVLVEATGPRAGGPVVLDVPTGQVVELRSHTEQKGDA